jgi:hypothetical protein
MEAAFLIPGLTNNDLAYRMLPAVMADGEVIASKEGVAYYGYESGKYVKILSRMGNSSIRNITTSTRGTTQWMSGRAAHLKIKSLVGTREPQMVDTC